MSNEIGCIGAGCTFSENQTKAHLMHHIRNDIPTKLQRNQVCLIPSRNDFLDPKLRNTFELAVKKRSPILFMPNTHVDKEVFGEYVVYLFGILPCGSKTCVMLKNAPLYTEIQVPDGQVPFEFEMVVRARLAAYNIIDVKHTKLFPFKYFHKEPVPHLKLFFKSQKDRIGAIDMLSTWTKENISAGKPPLEVTSNDNRANYFAKIARDYRFNTADWNRIEKYTVARAGTTACDYTLVVDINDIHPLDSAKKATLTKPGAMLESVLDKDHMVHATWDIETYSTNNTGIVPKPADTDYTIFMVCVTAFPYYSDKQLMGVCLVDVAANARDGIGIVVECGSEYGVLSAYSDVLAKIKPDIMSAFNGSNFDWPLTREKMYRYGLLVKLKTALSALPNNSSGKYADTEDSVYNWNFRKENMKITSENTHVMPCVTNFPGVLDTDVMPVFLKLYSKAEVKRAASLNYFLTANKLEAKEDMPYKRMFRIYERACKLAKIKSCHCGDAQKLCGTCNEHVRDIDYDDRGRLLDSLTHNGIEKCCYCGKKPQNLKDMGDVGYYCIIDCVRPQQLYVKRMIVQEKRALSTMSCVSLYDSFYRADGMKVCNLIGKYCNENNIAFPNGKSHKKDEDKDFYPGAWVFVPNRGLHSDRMIDVELMTADGHRVRRTVRGRPITGLDFSSLYPSLMITYNLTFDKIVKTIEEAQQLIAEGYALRHIGPFDFTRGAKKGAPENKKLVAEGWCVRHNGVHGGATKIVEGYNKFVTIEWIDPATGETKREKLPGDPGEAADAVNTFEADLNAKGCKTSRKTSYVPIRGRDALPGEQMGVFPSIVKDLFDMRVPIKAEFTKMCSLVDELVKAELSETELPNDDGTTRKITLDELKYIRDKIDTTQRAIKVLSNTFYGKSGEFRSEVYSLLVAGGITTAGQENIKKVANFVISKGFSVHYGDTDSLYISCPDELFAECDAEYEEAMRAIRAEFAGVPEIPEPERNTPEFEFKNRRVAERLVWWEKQVKISMTRMLRLKEEVSDFLMADNGTISMNMAYEEVGYPTVMCGKKKYFMMAHMKIINFFNEDVFIKGIDIVKQGQSPVSKLLGSEFIAEALSPHNELDLIDIAERKIRQFYKTKQDPNMFKLTKRYNIGKQNVSVHRFVARMKEIVENTADPTLKTLCEPPEPGDKFTYIVVRRPDTFLANGKRIHPSIGDKMEYIGVYEYSQSTDSPMEIDVEYYMTGQVAGIFARFIAYHPDFQPAAGMYDLSDKDEYKKMDQYCIKQASKFITRLCAEITGYDSSELTGRGRKYRKLYTRVDKLVNNVVRGRLGADTADIIMSIGGGGASDTLEEMLKKMEFPTNSSTILSEMLARPGMTIPVLRASYFAKTGGIMRTRIAWCDAAISTATTRALALIEKTARVTHAYRDFVETYVTEMRDVISLEEVDGLEEYNLRDFSPPELAVDTDSIDELRALVIKIATLNRTKKCTQELGEKIQNAWVEMTRDVVEPPAMRNKIRVAREETAAAKVIDEYTFK